MGWLAPRLAGGWCQLRGVPSALPLPSPEGHACFQIRRAAPEPHSATRHARPGPEKLLRVFDLSRPDADPETAALASNIRGAAWIHDNKAMLISYSDKPNLE